MGLIAYFMLSLQIGQTVSATAHSEHDTMCVQGKNTIFISLSIHILQVIVSFNCSS